MTPDPSRPAATSPDQYTLPIEEVAVHYEHAGHPRTIRSLQRYCAQGHLDCLRQQTSFGEKYLVKPESVGRHIAQIEELSATSSRDRTRLDATTVAVEPGHEQAPTTGATGADLSRQDAAEARYTERLEGESEFLRSQISVSCVGS